jgi:hypothetical protein
MLGCGFLKEGQWTGKRAPWCLAPGRVALALRKRNLPSLASARFGAYLARMDRLARIVFVLAALTIGWAPVARAGAMAEHLAWGAAAVHAHVAVPAGEHAAFGHHNPAPAGETENHALLHPFHCPACVAIAAVPDVQPLVGFGGPPDVAAAESLAFWRSAPEAPPPRA